jgi:hypothetical protein
MKSKFINIFIFTLLILHFYNFFNFRTIDQFKRWDFFDENMIQDRIVKSCNNGIGSSGYFNGAYNRENAIDSNLIQLGWILNNGKIQDRKFSVYLSQPGGQTIIFVYFGKLLGLNPLNIYKFSVFGVVCAVSLLFVLFFNYIHKSYSLQFAIIYLFFIILSPVFLDFAHRVWWSIYVFMLPPIIIIFRNNFNFHKKSNIFITTILLVVVKFFINGFEFITPFLGTIAIVYAILFFSNVSDIKYRNLLEIKTSLLMLLGSLTFGLCLCLALLFLQIMTFKGSKVAKSHIEISFLKRSTNFSNQSQPNKIGKYYGNEHDRDKITLIESINSKTYMVLWKYLRKPFFRIRYHKTFPLDVIKYWQVILFSLILAYWEKRQGYGNKTLLILVMSIISSFSWYFLFKGHAFIHGHLDEIALYMPLIPVSMFIIIKNLISFFNTNKLKIHPQ